ncbi:unnamed protein product [Tetraodon nigroviridis]|uniref:Chromosome undetermined SCAF14764, whole genome shotgun sequence n=1 Tax=Tetraodon nigroviridis TaxID=99883 RepID=Q4S275_TETNG|nr:unnamed protein product [Tetraodon nigroviridis]
MLSHADLLDARLVRSTADAETEAAPDPLHPGAAQRAGEELRQDALPGHLHAGGAGAEDRADGVQSAGLVPEPTRQMEEAQEDHQRLPSSGDSAAHAPRPASVPLGGGGGGGHGRQPLLLPRQRHPLGHGGDARRVSAAAAARARPPAGHGAVLVSVQPRRGPPPNSMALSNMSSNGSGLQSHLYQPTFPGMVPASLSGPTNVSGSPQLCSSPDSDAWRGTSIASLRRKALEHTVSMSFT